MIKIANNQRARVWILPNGKSNKALDCRVYAYAALYGLFHFGLNLNKIAQETTSTPEVAPKNNLPPAALFRSTPNFATDW